MQIFQDLSHPSALSNSVVARRSNEGKHIPETLTPGLSLFSLLSHTSTPQGSATLRQWFLSPLQSVEAIVERQNAIAFFEGNIIAEQVHDMRTGLKKMGDVHSGLNTIRRGGMPSSQTKLTIATKRKSGKKSSGALEWKSILNVSVYSL